MLGPTGLILGSTQWGPSLDKGTSREGKVNLIRCNHTVTPTAIQTLIKKLAKDLLSRNFDLALQCSQTTT